jgi:surfeit locus 1 family protein
VTRAVPERGGFVVPAIFTLVCLAILIGLGIWQLERREWKHNLIAALDTRLARAPQDLPPRSEWPRLDAARDEFARVAFPAEFLPGQEALVYSAGSALRPDVKGPGYWVFAPARLTGGSIVLVNRGFVPLDRKAADTRPQGAPTGVVDIVGVMRWPEQRGTFTPADEPQNNVWYLRDTQAMAHAKDWSVAAPFYIDQESPVPAGGLPLPGPLSVHLTDNHLQYAITWFGLAMTLIGVYLVWLFRRLRRRD